MRWVFAGERVDTTPGVQDWRWARQETPYDPFTLPAELRGPPHSILLANGFWLHQRRDDKSSMCHRRVSDRTTDGSATAVNADASQHKIEIPISLAMSLAGESRRSAGDSTDNIYRAMERERRKEEGK